MTYDVTPQKAWSETSYFMKCSDCEGEQEGCFSPEQAAEFANRDGWRALGPDDDSRIVCDKCAPGYERRDL